MLWKDRQVTFFDDFAAQESCVGWLARSSRVPKELWHLPPRLQFESPFGHSLKVSSMENTKAKHACARDSSTGSRAAGVGDQVWVRWAKVWAPETGGWSVGVVKEISNGRTKNPNGPGLVTRGWSVVEYPENELHIHHLDEAHHFDVIGDTEMAWRHVSAHCGLGSADPGPREVRRERPSRLAYGKHKRKRRRTTSLSTNAESQSVVNACEPPTAVGEQNPENDPHSSSQTDQIEGIAGAISVQSEARNGEDDEGMQDVDIAWFYEFPESVNADGSSQSSPPQTSLQERDAGLPSDPDQDTFQLRDNAPAPRNPSLAVEDHR
eukprot:1645619-Rhodomonas_salina.1